MLLLINKKTFPKKNTMEYLKLKSKLLQEKNRFNNNFYHPFKNTDSNYKQQIKSINIIPENSEDKKNSENDVIISKDNENVTNKNINSSNIIINKKTKLQEINTDVTVAMCTQPHRKKSMLRVVESLLPQCTRMCICFNNYDEIPKELPKSDKLICVLAGEGKQYKDLGCLNKMLWIGDFPGYYATVDDDLIYSPNYIEELKKKVDYYKGECICTYHGKKFEIDNGRIVNDKYNLYYYYSIYKEDIICTIGGMGVAMMMPQKLGITKDLYLKYPKNYGDDEITAIYAAEHSIKIYRVSNTEVLVKPSEEAYTGMWSDKNSRDTRLNILLNYKDWKDYINHDNDIFFRVIIPTYNTSDYIKRCLDSINNQSFKNFKVIVVDDNSQDKHITKKICDEYDFVQYVQLNNHMDAGGCRNTGLQYYKDSKYTLFCDSDDYYMDDKAFEKLYNHIKNNNFPNCVNFSFYYESKNTIYRPCFMEVPWCHCIKTKLCKLFKAYRRKHNDVIWYLRQFDGLENITKLNECLYYYTNQSPTSLQLDNVNKYKYNNRVLSSYFYLLADLLEESFKTPKIKKEATNFFRIIYNRIKDEYTLNDISDVISK